MLLIVGLLLGMAQSGGIGGGGLISPILILSYNYSAGEAVRYTYLFMFFASIGSYSQLKSESFNGKPTINYELALLVLPLMMSGAIYGVSLNKFVPNIIIFMALLYILYTMYFKTKT